MSAWLNDPYWAAPLSRGDIIQFGVFLLVYQVVRLIAQVYWSKK